MTPLDKLATPEAEAKNIQLYIKRDDLIHPDICGNKWRKLKYQIQQYQVEGKTSIITWGGSRSNHLHAISYWARDHDLDVTAFIPQDQTDNYPPSLVQAVKNGLQIRPVSRSEFRRRYDPIYLAELKSYYPDIYLIPEGGSSPTLLQGVEEMAQECIDQCPDQIDYWILPVGTGGTMLGILHTIDQGEVIGISVIKKGRQSKWIKNNLKSRHKIKWTVTEDYCLGGMGRYTDDLINSMNNFKSEFNILLDPIYTGKMVYAVKKLIENNTIKPNSTAVMIHTGGLIGIDNFLDKNPKVGLNR